MISSWLTLTIKLRDRLKYNDLIYLDVLFNRTLYQEKHTYICTYINNLSLHTCNTFNAVKRMIKIVLCDFSKNAMEIHEIRISRVVF